MAPESGWQKESRRSQLLRRRPVKPKLIEIGRAVVAIPVVVTITVAVVIAVPAAAVIVAPVVRPFAPFTVAAVDDFEIGATAAVDPNAVAVIAPGAIEDAIGFATLADDEDAVARVRGAELAIHVVGGAVDERGGAGLPVASDAEIGTAAAVNPNAALAETPSLALDASGLAALANQAHTEARIGGAPGALHVVCGAVDHVGIAEAAEVVIMAAELTVASAVVANSVVVAVVIPSCVVVASAVNTKKEKLLIVTGIWRKDLEMSSIVV
jgi:hypothetical protein